MPVADPDPFFNYCSMLPPRQGEKAYSCAQCNTRFTYRNGLIKHTKLNRCPKKILTAEGETIMKKRTRVLAKDPLSQVGTSHQSWAHHSLKSLNRS